MNCPNCHVPMPAAAERCEACGAAAPPRCPSCGNDVPPAARYCPACGTAIGAGAAATGARVRPGGSPPAPGDGPDDRAERRQLTVLFCDLVGSTEISTRLDPEDFRNVVGAYHRCVASTVRVFDGYVALLLGDGAVVYFGFPHGHEDNAARAVRAALALVAEVGKLNPLGQPLHVRIGVATGMVVVGDLLGAGAVREWTAMGETPNLAARLQTLAEPDTVLIADATKRLVGSRFTYRDLGGVAVKGFVAPVQVWRVVAAAPTPDSFAALRPDAPGRTPAVPCGWPTPLVGRDQELGLLHDCWERIAEGQGRVVLVMGDPGIGKTRLVQTLVADVAEHPHVLLELRCSEDHANTPLYPVVRLLWSVLAWSPGDADEVRLDKLAAFAGRYRVSPGEGVPLLASLLSLPPSPRFPAPPMSPERQKQRTLETLRDAVLAVAAERPVLAVVEDLHWADPTTREFLTLVIEQVATARMLVLLTARFQFESTWQPHAHFTPVVLTRLTRRQAGEMVSRVARAQSLPAAVVERIVARADGVPLYIEELTRMVVDAGVTAAPGSPAPPGDASASPAIPATLQDSLMARLDRLDGGKAIAQLCATLGREFSYAMLRAVAEQDEDELDRELRRLVDAEFLHQRGVPPDATYVFKHALIREAAYESLLRSTRRGYHRRIAHAMASRFAKEAEAQPEYVAMQFAEGGELCESVRWWQNAGRRAVAHAAFAEAAAHYERGLALLRTIPPSTDRDQRELELQVELGYALIPVRGWSAADTAQAFTRAGDLCDAIGETPAHFRARWGLGAFHLVRGDQHRARRVAEQCVAAARRSNDVDARMEAHLLCGIVACVTGEFAAGLRDLDACVRLYGPEPREAHRVLYGQDPKASALGWMAMAQWTCGRPDEALATAEGALAFLRGARQPFLLARGLAALGFVHVFREEPQGPGSPLADAVALCAEQGFKYFHAVVSAFHGAGFVHAGRFDDGIATMRANVDTLRAIGSELLLTIVFANLAAAHLALGQVAAGLAAVDEGLACVERNGERWAEAELHRLRGRLLLARAAPDATAAEACFRKALEVARTQGATAYELRAAADLADLGARRGRDRTAVAVAAAR